MPYSHRNSIPHFKMFIITHLKEVVFLRRVIPDEGYSKKKKEEFNKSDQSIFFGGKANATASCSKCPL